MLTILSSLLGLFGSGLPKLFDFLQDRSDKKHELAILQMQLEAQKQGHVQRIEEINVQGDIQSQVAAYDFAKRQETGVRWVDAALEFICGIVRPSITFALVFFYMAYKMAVYQGMVNSGMVWDSALQMLWTEEDMMLLTGVISFWFGQRAFYRNSNK